MKRRLFTILSALSLLLFVAVVALWVASHRYAVTFQLRYPPRDSAKVTFHRGQRLRHAERDFSNGIPGGNVDLRRAHPDVC